MRSNQGYAQLKHGKHAPKPDILLLEFGRGMLT